MAAENSSLTPSTKTRRFRRALNNSSNNIACLQQISNPDPPPIETTGCKSTISAFFLSNFITTNAPTKKKIFSNATYMAFKGLGCSSSSEVHLPKSAPALARSSADWQSKRGRKKSPKTHQKRKQTNPIGVPDVWCSPGISVSTDAASVDFVVSRRPALSNSSNLSDFNGRNRDRRSVASYIKSEAERNHRERPCIARRTTNLEQIDSPSTFKTRFSGSDLLQTRSYRHLRALQRSPAGLAEIMMLQTSLLLGEMEVYDRYRDWRLDVDSMSYEELLDLGDRIGYVSTGLREEEIVCCLRKVKHSILDALPSHFPSAKERKCSICQEEYEENDEMGRLECGHTYHIICIKQWLLRKNACPVCKAAAVAAAAAAAAAATSQN